MGFFIVIGIVAFMGWARFEGGVAAFLVGSSVAIIIFSGMQSPLNYMERSGDLLAFVDHSGINLLANLAAFVAAYWVGRGAKRLIKGHPEPEPEQPNYARRDVSADELSRLSEAVARAAEPEQPRRRYLSALTDNVVIDHQEPPPHQRELTKEPRFTRTKDQ